VFVFSDCVLSGLPLSTTFSFPLNISITNGIRQKS
jgi:hypothetical protein